MNRTCSALLILCLSMSIDVVRSTKAGEKEDASSKKCTATIGEDVERRLAGLEIENQNLLWKIEELEAKLERSSVAHKDCQEELHEAEKSGTKCKGELVWSIGEMTNIKKEAVLNANLLNTCNGLKDELEKNNKEHSGELDKLKQSTGISESQKKDMEELQNKANNCEETLKIVRDKYQQDSTELKNIQRLHEKLAKTGEECSEKLKIVDAEKGHLEFLKKGYDMVIQELETESKGAKEQKEKCENMEKLAIQGAASYRFYLTLIGITLLIGGTVKFYSIAKDKLEKRRLELVEARKLEKKESAKKRGGKSDKTKPATKQA